MTSKLQAIANRIVDSVAHDEVSNVATFGFKGELPESLDEDERFELLNLIQDAAKCAEAASQ